MPRLVAPAAVRPAPTRRMRDRVPAQARIEQVLRARAAVRPRTVLERMVGVDPIGGEALAWYAGARCARAVAGRLTKLPAGWTVFHSLPVGRADGEVDHLVVGPGGVFAVDVRHHRDAAAWVAGHAVLAGGRRRPHVQRAESHARRVDRVVAGVLEGGPAVRPVIAVVGAKRLVARGGRRGAPVLRAEQLLPFLASRPAVLTPPQVAALVERFDDAATWRSAPEAAPELLLAFADLGRDLARAARVRAAWITGLLALTATGATMLLLPALPALLGR